MEDPETIKMCFVISGDFLTQQSRNLWTERPLKALALLDCLDLPESIQVDIITGKKALVGDNEYELVDDDATENQYGAKLPSIKDVIKKLEEELWLEKELLSATRQYLEDSTCFVGSPGVKLKIPYSWSTTNENGRAILKLWEGEIWEEGIARVLKYFPDAQQGTHPVALRDLALSGLPLEIDPKTLEAKTSGAVFGFQDEKGKIVLNDREFSCRDGFILPDGTFHGCGYCQHQSLLNELELDKEPDNWAKVQDSRRRRQDGLRVDQEYIYYPDKPTQKQLDTIFDWGQKHGIEIRFPDEFQAGA